MALTRPNRGDPVIVEDFGQPVYDALMLPQNRGTYGGGNLNSAGPFSPGVPTPVTVNGYSSPGAFLTTNGVLTCQVPGAYLIVLSCIISQFGNTPAGTYCGCNVRVNNVDVVPTVNGWSYYWTSIVGTRIYTLKAGDVISLVFNTDIPFIMVDNRSQLTVTAIAGG